MKDYAELAQKVRLLIGKDQITDAFKVLLGADLPTFEKEIRVLESRYTRETKAQRSGVVDRNEASISLNKIIHALIDLTKEIEAYPQKANSEQGKKKKAGIFAIVTSLVIIISVAGIVLSNSSNDEQNEQKFNAECAENWRDCLEKNDVAIYEVFIQSPCINDSLQSIAESNIYSIKDLLAWEAASSANTAEGYFTYLTNYPEGNSVDKAKEYVIGKKYKSGIIFQVDESGLRGKLYLKKPYYENVREDLGENNAWDYSMVVNNRVGAISIEGVDGWRLPTYDELIVNLPELGSMKVAKEDDYWVKSSDGRLTTFFQAKNSNNSGIACTGSGCDNYLFLVKDF